MNTQSSDRGNEPVTWNQFHTFANQMDARFIAIEARFNELDKRFNELDAKINQLRGEFLEFKEEMRLVPVKIAGWVAGARFRTRRWVGLNSPRPRSARSQPKPQPQRDAACE